MWSHFVRALSFLTIFRLPFTRPQHVSPQDLAHTFAFFPLVGLVLGALLWLFAHLFTPLVPPLLLAVLLTATLTVLTRALHLDGLADMVDGVGGGYTPQRRLEIMKDSRTGAFGALALVLALLFKAAAFHTLILTGRLTPLLFIPTLSRYAMPLTAYKSPYARSEGGLGKAFLEYMSAQDLLIATLCAFTPALPLAGLHAPIYLSSLLLIVFLLRRYTRQWLGGITGDVLGAANEITEIVLFTLAACLAHH